MYLGSEPESFGGCAGGGAVFGGVQRADESWRGGGGGLGNLGNAGDKCLFFFYFDGRCRLNWEELTIKRSLKIGMVFDHILHKVHGENNSNGLLEALNHKSRSHGLQTYLGLLDVEYT